MKNEKVHILGSDISIWDLEETTEKLRQLTLDSRKHYVCVSNVHTVIMGQQDPEYACVTNEATIATADGVPLIWASQFLGGPVIHGRASGPDILSSVLSNSACQDLRHYFYGSTPKVIEKLKVELSRKFPQAQIVGSHSPPMRPARRLSEPLDAEELADCRTIDKTAPHIVWVGLGAPKQEFWMARVRSFLQAPVIVGVGAAFDFLAGFKKRAPHWMQISGLEWAHRLLQEPRRLAGRYFSTNPRFILGVIGQAMKRG